ncbi:hypothetical protein [Kitasatospora sp. NBC_01300]|uniref:hypothetical protein n=1 Tax=Kitasatospora sp. NBC_01300 TaxID=2903574 RepID=UPI00352E83FB
MPRHPDAPALTGRAAHSSRHLLSDLGGVGTARLTRAGGWTPGTRGGALLLLISGQEDRMVPDSVTRSVYKLYGDSTATRR